MDDRSIRRLEVDFDRGSPFTEFQWVDVVVSVANSPITVRHELEGPNSALTYAIMGVRLDSASPTASPALYELTTTPRGDRYLKLYGTEPGTYRVLLTIER